MKLLLYILILVMVGSGVYLYFFEDIIIINWIHYAAGFSLSAVFLLFGADHTEAYLRRSRFFSFAFISGSLLWVVGAVAILSGFVVFFYEVDEVPHLIQIHGISAAAFCAGFIIHLLKKKR